MLVSVSIQQRGPYSRARKPPAAFFRLRLSNATGLPALLHPSWSTRTCRWRVVRFQTLSTFHNYGPEIQTRPRASLSVGKYLSAHLIQCSRCSRRIPHHDSYPGGQSYKTNILLPACTTVLSSPAHVAYKASHDSSA